MKGKNDSVVAVLDCGGQYIDLVRKACIRLGFSADVLPHDTPLEHLKTYKAIIISGSPANSQEAASPMPDPALWQSSFPILGICFGMQAMAQANGGKVERGTTRQDGRITTNVDTTHPLFKDTKPAQSALFTHGNFVTALPADFQAIGQHKLHSGKTTYSAIANGKQVGVQFHPEVFDDTPEGYQIFRNFLEDIAGLKADPNLVATQTKAVIKRLRDDIRKHVGSNHVIAFVSGGVDSAVTVALAATEVPAAKLHAFYIDNGLMRDEDDTVIEQLKALGVPVEKYNASEYFSNATIELDGKTIGPLNQVVDPQHKRQIIGKAFIDVQNQLISRLGLSKAMLLQGTNAADRIESGHSKGGKATALIKTHHNQVKEVQELKAQGLVIEPLDELFKDEVRAVGTELGLPAEIVWRQPFPGPGLAVRILCAHGDEFEKQDPRVETSIQEFVNDIGKAKLLPIRNVGVGGDERSHVAAVALQPKRLDWERMGELAVSIPGHFRNDVNRVVVTLGPQPIDSLTVTPTVMDEATRAQLRHVDRIVFEEMRAFKVLRDIIQFPVVLLPLSFNKKGDRSIVLRPITTSTFMTVQAMLPGRDLPEAFVQQAAKRILTEVPGISQVFLDLTNKPPATTEWE